MKLEQKRDSMSKRVHVNVTDVRDSSNTKDMAVYNVQGRLSLNNAGLKIDDF